MIFMTENAAHEAFQKTEVGKALNAYHIKMQDAMRENDDAILNYEKEHYRDAPEFMYACNNLALSSELAARAVYNAAFGTWLDACEHKIAEMGDE